MHIVLGSRGRFPVSGRGFESTAAIRPASKSVQKRRRRHRRRRIGTPPAGYALVKQHATAITMIFTHAHLEPLDGCPFSRPCFQARKTDLARPAPQ